MENCYHASHTHFVAKQHEHTLTQIQSANTRYFKPKSEHQLIQHGFTDG